MINVLGRKIESTLTNIVVSYITPDVTTKMKVTAEIAKARITRKLREKVIRDALKYAQQIDESHKAAIVNTEEVSE
jgi:hypothetical protein